MRSRAVAAVAASPGPPAGEADTAAATCVAAVLQPCILDAQHASSRSHEHPDALAMFSPSLRDEATNRRKPSSGRRCRSVGQPWSVRPKL